MFQGLFPAGLGLDPSPRERISDSVMTEDLGRIRRKPDPRMRHGVIPMGGDLEQSIAVIG